MSLLSLTPAAFTSFLKENGISRFSLTYDAKSNSVISSHPLLQELADFLMSDSRDFDKHEGVFVQVGPESGVLQSAVVHRTCRGSGAGGVRNFFFPTLEQFLRDGLRLSRGMTHKNALAGLFWGGGKGVMDRNTGSGLEAGASAASRAVVYREYGLFMSSLRGCYITAEDVGTSVEDMGHVFSGTRFTTCISPKVGGSGNPSVPTARGIIRGLEACLAHLGMGSIEGKTVAVQGVGHVGTPFIHYLFEAKVGKVIASDIDESRRAEIEAEFAGKNFELRIAAKGDNSILFVEADAVCPCATGGVLSPETISHIKAPIVCGAANNQLLDLQNDDKLLHARGIVYAPDFLVNRMGIVHCADESFGYVDSDPLLEKHLGAEWSNSIFCLMLEVLRLSKESGRTTQQIALEMAEKASFEHHPITGHRGVRIIESLVQRKWAESAPLSTIH